MNDEQKSSDITSAGTDKNVNSIDSAYKSLNKDGLASANNSHMGKASKKPLLRRINLTNKQRIIIGSVSIALIAGGIIAKIVLTKPAPTAKIETPVVSEPATPTTVPSKLTGLDVAPEVNERTVTGVMIENSPDARPQSGLKDAGVVYEAVAEGGITRFMAVFQDTIPEYIGPVRSVRPYYLDFITPYDAGLAHVGGSGQALAEMKAEGLKDLDQFANPSAYWRESSRYAPHNMYTNLAKLKEVEKSKGWNGSNYTGFVRGEKAGASPTPNAQAINIRMSSTLYNVEYRYDTTSNTYLRSEGGKPHKDAKTDTQLAPSVVVVPVIPRSQNGIYSVYNTTAGGKVFVFQNGNVTEGTWSKANRKSQFVFTGADGQPLKLIAGQTWVTIAASAADVTFTP